MNDKNLKEKVFTEGVENTATSQEKEEIFNPLRQ
jgi:hypothetical protein